MGNTVMQTRMRMKLTKEENGTYLYELCLNMETQTNAVEINFKLDKATTFENSVGDEVETAFSLRGEALHEYRKLVNENTVSNAKTYFKEDKLVKEVAFEDKTFSQTWRRDR